MKGFTTWTRPKLANGQAREILESLNIEIQTEDDTHFMVMCPFHKNTNSAACSVAKDTGFFMCFNTSCSARGELIDLIQETTHWDRFRSLRYIAAHKGPERSFEQVMNEIEASSEEMPEFDQEVFAKMRQAFLDNQQPRDYMYHRGFVDRTLDEYQIGFDPNRQMVLVPMFDTNNRCVGVVGRTCQIGGPKRFKNSVNLPTKKTLFGINIAKRMNTANVVICESSFDAMRVWQAGYASVATLGGTFSDYHKTQLARHFDSITLMVDSDEAGQKFAAKIARGAKQRKLAVYQARYSPLELFPDDCKDASDCTDQQIAAMIKNRVFYTED